MTKEQFKQLQTGDKIYAVIKETLDVREYTVIHYSNESDKYYVETDFLRYYALDTEDCKYFFKDRITAYLEALCKATRESIEAIGERDDLAVEKHRLTKLHEDKTRKGILLHDELKRILREDIESLPEELNIECKEHKWKPTEYEQVYYTINDCGLISQDMFYGFGRMEEFGNYFETYEKAYEALPKFKQALESVKDVMWKPFIGDKYYYVDCAGWVKLAEYEDNTKCKCRISFGNAFATERQAQEASNKIQEELNKGYIQ